MFCERCSAALPSHGYICKKCGAMMTKSQMEIQKSINKENRKNQRPSYMSDQYGIKKDFKLNNDNNYDYYKVIFIIFIILIVFISLMLIIL